MSATVAHHCSEASSSLELLATDMACSHMTAFPPPPAPQWDRAQAVGVMGGVTVAVYAIVACLRAAEPQHIELFHIYYQPLIVCLAMLWMWGADVRLFERRRIAYTVCFSAADQQHLLSSQQLFQACAASASRLYTTPPHRLCAYVASH